MKIYIAGQMNSNSGWQDTLAALLPGHEFIDPRTHGLTNPSEYTAWDLEGIRRSDIVIAFMSSENPSGYGLNLEVGYAYALGRPTIFIDQIGKDWRDKYFGMARSVSTVVVYTIEEAAFVVVEALFIAQVGKAQFDPLKPMVVLAGDLKLAAERIVRMGDWD